MSRRSGYSPTPSETPRIAAPAPPRRPAGESDGGLETLMAARKDRIRRAFDQAGATYEAAATVQAWAADLLSKDVLRWTGPLSDPRVLEIGCGTGLLTASLLPRVTGGTWLATDLAPGMIDRIRHRFDDPRLSFAVVDGEHAGSELGRFDLIVSNMTVQWFADLPGGLRHLAALLRPGGVMAVTAPGAGSFPEWRRAHAALGLPAGITALPSAGALGAAPADTPSLAVETRYRPLSFPDARAFLRSIRDLGAHIPHPGHKALSPGQMRRLLRLLGEDVTITYEVHFALWRHRMPRPE